MAEKLMRNMFATHTDYADFKGLISANPAFVPSNVDGIAERNGHFLIMEWKRPGERASEGQKRLLQALAATPKFMVVVIIGDTDNGTNIQEFWQYTTDGKAFKSGLGFGSFKEFYKLWYELADGYKK
jgi:hypothetical protein